MKRENPKAERTEEAGGAADTAWEWAKSIGGGILIFLVIRTFILQSFAITSGSMEETLLVGDLLFVSRAAYGAQVPGTDLRLPGYEEPDRNEVVVFRWAHQPGVDVVKRLVGIPGDTLRMREGVLYVDGEPQVEPFAWWASTEDPTHEWMAWQRRHLAPGVAAEDYRPSLRNWGPIVVPEGQYFVMGDNRANSLDSRYWGFVDEDWLRGHALVLYYSYDPDVLRPFPWVLGMRPGRIGDVIR